MRAQPQEPMFRPRSRFHLFTIVRLLGRGGMAEVYEVQYQGRRYALKVLQRKLQLDPSQLKRFESEGRFLLRVRHPNLVDVQDMGVNEGVFWIRMELLSGMDLREAIHRLGPMSVGLVGAWLRLAAYGAHQCHSFGVIHRDIKPENVMLLRPDGVKLLDLGVAKIDGELVTLEGGPEEGLRGTALYMSPEQVNNAKHITPAADVYALGMTGWEMLHGENPLLLGGQRFELLPTLYKQVHEEVPPLHHFGFERRLSRVFERALSKDWRKRQPTGLAFAEDLGEAVEHYLDAHPDDDPNPGEPALAWLFGEARAIPSFGTGPMAGRGASGAGPRPSAPMPVGPLGSANELPRGAGPIPRFHTQPIVQVPAGWGSPQLHEPVIDPEERVTNLAPVPLGIRRFDTVSLPPELRDPSALRALAGYRREGKKMRRAAAEPASRRERMSMPGAAGASLLRAAHPRAPRAATATATTTQKMWTRSETPVSSPAVILPETEARAARRPDAPRRTAPMKLALLVLFVGLWGGAWRETYLHFARPTADPLPARADLDAGSAPAAPADAGLPAALAADAGLVATEPGDGGPRASRARDAGPPIPVKPPRPPPSRKIVPPRKPAREPIENIF
jgi:eukaryotic-like serine/threonine-protein kinase